MYERDVIELGLEAMAVAADLDQLETGRGGVVGVRQRRRDVHGHFRPLAECELLVDPDFFVITAP